MELYFWAFVVAVSIFFVGAALSIYEGVKKLLHPEPVEAMVLALTVLGVSVLFEAYPWWVAFSEARKMRRRKGLAGFVDMAVTAKNPTVMVVLLEDTAALLGLTVAALGLVLADVMKLPVFDGIASVTIGLILLAIALFLARETKALLIGESATREDRHKIREVLANIAEIKRCGRLLTMHLGPDDILLNLDVEFVDNLSTDELEAVIDRIELHVKEAVPAVTRIYIEAEAIRKKPGKDRQTNTHGGYGKHP
jgi:cation diffusion facilitator family transporter